MICPRCGKAVLASTGKCPGCGAGIAVGTLTPPPTGEVTASDLTTMFGANTPAGETDAGEATIFVAPDTPAAPTAGPTGTVDADATIFVAPETSAAPTAPVTPDEPVTEIPTALPSATISRAGSAPGDPLGIGQSFGSRYHIIRLLGQGGMGAVYQAWDAELGEAVAIKVVRPEITADPAAAADMERRFKRELVLARQVTHKNVVRIHDLGEIDGIKYITMPYVEGADLATVMREHGRLPLAKTLRIIKSVVSGLTAAHAADIVHRDLKPANIMIDANDDALIMDFGIARSTGMPVGGGKLPGETTLAGNVKLAMARPEATVAGTIVGTVEYMAPEQARGQHVDQRADVYAIGLILYDMLAGRSRSALAKPIEELKARMNQAPAPIRTIVPDVPEPVAAIVARCLDPDPAKRYQKTLELAAELDRLDEDGHLIPIRRVFGTRVLAAIILLALTVAGAGWWYARQFIPPAQHDPVSVVISDLENNTTDPALSRVLEPMLKRALEDAGFISAYDRSGISRTLGVRPPDRLDEAAAREIAVRQGLGVVLSGAIDRLGSSGFEISVKAAQAVTGQVITTAKGRASNKDQIVGVATKLVTTVRKALGDETSDSAQLFAMASVSATSLDVIRYYAAAREAASNNKLEEARANYAKAIELDPKFGIGYQALSTLSQNLGNMQDADKYINEALRHLDGMTERERYTTRGLFDFLTGDYQQCVKEYSDLIASYPADVAAHNNLALCLSSLRKMPEAVEEMRRVVRLVPKQAFFRVNLALYASYASDFQTGEREALEIQEPDARGVLALAFAQLGQGDVAKASETYQKLSAIDALGASSGSAGLADIAIYGGHFSDAVRMLEQGAAADLAAKNADRAAMKFTSVAYANLARGQNRAAIAAAEKALSHSQAAKIRFLAARTFVEGGEPGKTEPLVKSLSNELQAEPQGYAKIVEGLVALKSGNARQAIKLLTDANGLFDTWIGHFDLGRAYFAFGAFPQADAEFDRCLKRRGEAISLFLDEDPTYGYFPTAYYYQGRVREELKTERFREAYREYLNIRGNSKEDSLLQDVRRRAGT
jgi:tetratricopeptide (TPR) repeat protein